MGAGGHCTGEACGQDSWDQLLVLPKVIGLCAQGVLIRNRGAGNPALHAAASGGQRYPDLMRRAPPSQPPFCLLFMSLN